MKMETGVKEKAFLFGLLLALASGMLLFLSGCAPKPVKVSPDSGSLQPVLQVFVAPKTPMDTGSQKALLAWVELPEDLSPRYSTVMTETLQDILLQHRVFLLTAIPEKREGDRDLTSFAREIGFDYLILAKVPSLLVPAGDSPGWIGLDLKVQNVRSGVTVWHIYGETDLVPQLGNYGIFVEEPFRPAPTIAQGFTAIARAGADILLKGGNGRN